MSFQKGNQINKNRRHTEAWKEKTRSIMLGHKVSEETKEKISIANRGKKLTEEQKQKLRILRLGVKHSVNTKKKISENRIGINNGEKHYRWIKDRSLINRQERNNPEYKQWRYQVFKRDYHKCKINSKDCCGKVVAHHILPWQDYPNERYNINNGITLCQFQKVL